MGAGHHATAAALEKVAHRLWPGCTTKWVDVLEAMGPGVGPLFRRIYVLNVQTTPWLYEFFYRLLWRYRWFSRASKRFVGAWAGRRLARIVDEYDPDLVISTYPFGGAGMQWLRQHRGLRIPAVTWIPDFAPHPFWVYRDLDMHFVMHDECLRLTEDSDPGAAAAVAAPPVTDAFTPGESAQAREALGFAADEFVAVISCGYYGFGTVQTAAETLLRLDPKVRVVALCGRNERLRARLAAHPEAPDRLAPLGWVDDMPRYLRACDVVVTNGNAATALEALACGRALVMFEPIAAHGRANADVMARAGLALLCPTARELETTVRDLLDDRNTQAALEKAGLAHTQARAIEDDLRLAVSFGRTTSAGS